MSTINQNLYVHNTNQISPKGKMDHDYNIEDCGKIAYNLTLDPETDLGEQKAR